MPLNSLRQGRASTVDTNDIVGILVAFIGAGMLSGGLPTEIFGYEFATALQFTVAGYSIALPTMLVVGSFVYIMYTNSLLNEWKDLTDIQSFEGAAFVGGIVAVLVAIVEPQFFVNNVSGVTEGVMWGSVVYTAIVGLAASVVATY